MKKGKRRGKEIKNPRGRYIVVTEKEIEDDQ